MSQIKENSKKLAEIAKKYGYEIKHTHALEIISQLELNTNRHAALRQEEKLNQTIASVTASGSFELSFHKPAIVLPFFESHVIQFFFDDELVEFVVADELGLALELMGERVSDITKIKVVTPAELQIKYSKAHEDMSEEEYNKAVENQKTLLEYILEKQKQTKSTSFSVFNDYL